MVHVTDFSMILVRSLPGGVKIRPYDVHEGAVTHQDGAGMHQVFA